MRAWRPARRCLYVIPELGGNAASLEIMLGRILPLRWSDGQTDRLFMLGGYVGRGPDSHIVVETLMGLTLSDEDITMLRGAPEQLMCEAYRGDESAFQQWRDSYGGAETIQSYLRETNISSTARALPSSRLRDVIPESHIRFLEQLPTHVETEGWALAYGGFNPHRPLAENQERNFCFDPSSASHVISSVGRKTSVEFQDNMTFVGCVNPSQTKQPFTHQRYCCLGQQAPSECLIFELQTRRAVRIRAGKTHMYPYEIKVVG